MKGWEQREVFSMFDVDEIWSDSEELEPDKWFMHR
jgi:hypothetical protein